MRLQSASQAVLLSAEEYERLCRVEEDAPRSQPGPRRVLLATARQFVARYARSEAAG